MPSQIITILMCTFNGARHLPEQLASLCEQTHPDWALWVSDDGSTDGTLEILTQFRAENPRRDIRLLTGPGQGAAANFLSLLCHPDLSPRYVALCDQDDVWLPGKLERALTFLAGTPRAAVDVYAAQSIVTDEDLAPTGRIDNTRRGPSFANALVQNILHGATLVLSPNAHAHVRAAGIPGTVPFHDWWIYGVMTGCGLRIGLDRTPVLLYRQHGTNEIGFNRARGAVARRLTLIADRRYRQWTVTNARALAAVPGLLTEKNRQILSAFLHAQDGGGIARARAYAQLDLHRQRRRDTALLFTLAALGYA